MLYFAHSMGGHRTTSCGRGTAGNPEDWDAFFVDRECNIDPYDVGYDLVVESDCESVRSCPFVAEAPGRASSSSSVSWSGDSLVAHGGGCGLAWAVAITC